MTHNGFVKNAWCRRSLSLLIKYLKLCINERSKNIDLPLEVKCLRV